MSEIVADRCKAAPLQVFVDSQRSGSLKNFPNPRFPSALGTIRPLNRNLRNLCSSPSQSPRRDRLCGSFKTLTTLSPLGIELPQNPVFNSICGSGRRSRPRTALDSVTAYKLAPYQLS
jgi:hypothetical protein